MVYAPFEACENSVPCADVPGVAGLDLKGVKARFCGAEGVGGGGLHNLVEYFNKCVHSPFVRLASVFVEDVAYLGAEVFCAELGLLCNFYFLFWG